MEQEDARGEGTVPLVSLHLWVKAASPPSPLAPRPSQSYGLGANWFNSWGS